MPDVEAFSALPILQIFVGGVTLIVSVWMMVQAQRDKKAIQQASPVPLPDGQTMMIQGLQSLREICHGLNNVATILTAIDAQHRRLQDITHTQTDRHAELMREMQRIGEAILWELQHRNRN